jgi:formylglycine-generating enzyme required for sulfatase activity
VTSREYACKNQQWQLSGFYEATLDNFSRGQIQQFIDRWYNYYGVKFQGISPDDALTKAKSLKDTIFKNQSLLDLAKSPLLLTLMARINSVSGGSLPETRERLYAQAVELLLDKRERSKIVRDHNGNVSGPAHAEWMRLDAPKNVRHLLNTLAFEMAQKNESKVIFENDLVSGLTAASNNPDVKPKRLIEYLCERSGIIIPAHEKHYRFSHHIFQEYLAACYLAGENYPDKIVELFQNDLEKWQEILLLTGAKAFQDNNALIWLLINALCDSPPNDNFIHKNQLWSAHIAAQALLETVDLEQHITSSKKLEKVKQLIQWLLIIIKTNELPPLERAMAGNNLAIMGDPRADVINVDEMLFCLVPEGKFWMNTGQNKFDREPKLFLLGKYPVTNAQFKAFIDDGGYENNKYFEKAIKDGKLNKDLPPESQFSLYNYGCPFNLPNHPVVGISWYEAIAFTKWLTERWKKNDFIPGNWYVTLASEEQWVKAARGGEKIPEQPVCESVKTLCRDFKKYHLINNPNPEREYPWGDCDLLGNLKQNGIDATSSVGCFPEGKSPYGCEEMSGNVWEWTRPIETSNQSNEDKKAVIKGAGFNDFANCILGYCEDFCVQKNDLGFRVLAAVIGT